MKLNTASSRPSPKTHEGGPAWGHMTPEQALRRVVLSCMLWEDSFYIDGQELSDVITELAKNVPAKTLSDIAIEARDRFNLRHVPLLLTVVLAQTGRQNGSLISDTVASVVRRADEPAELLAIYWKLNGRKMISKQIRRGLERALRGFDEYQFKKYDRDGAIKLRDVFRLVRPRPLNGEQSALFKRVVTRTLKSAKTWETALSGGADKKESFEDLIRAGKLGYMALLRNLRNMSESGVDEELVRQAIVARKGARKVLPFRYTAAARAAPRFEPQIDQALNKTILEMPPLSGKTIVLVDVSGSMSYPLSGKSDMSRMDAAATLASVIHGDLRVFSFSSGNAKYLGDRPTTKILVEVPPRRGIAGVEAVINSQEHRGTYLGKAVHEANEIPHDRLIVITDEQSADPVPDPVAKLAYMINVASDRYGVGYGRWLHIDGFSEAVLSFIYESELLT